MHYHLEKKYINMKKYLKSVKKKGIISDVGSLEIRKAVSKEWTENRRSET